MAILRFNQLDNRRGCRILSVIHPKQVEDYPNNLKRFGQLLIKYNIRNERYNQLLLDIRLEKIKSILNHKKD